METTEEEKTLEQNIKKYLFPDTQWTNIYNWFENQMQSKL